MGFGRRRKASDADQPCRELIEVCFADQDSAFVEKPLYNGRVLFRHMTELRTGRGSWKVGHTMLSLTAKGIQTAVCSLNQQNLGCCDRDRFRDEIDPD